MRLTDDELREVLERAEEIERRAHTGVAMRGEMEAVISAAGEIGLSRSAVEQALRERLDYVVDPVVGEHVFARSADGKYYVAETVGTTPEGVRVRFLRGGELLLAPNELRPCRFVPGQSVMCNWPWWGPWRCSVVTYDERSQFLTLSDRWGSTTVTHMSEVWLEPAKKLDDRAARRRAYLALITISTSIGAILGSALTLLLAR